MPGHPAPDLARAAEQAKDFQTYGMPDDWANYGGVLKAFAEKYGFELKRTDTDMTSMEEITKYDAEKANPVAVSSDIGLIYGPIAEEVGVVPPYLPPSAETLPAGLKGRNGGWVATFTGVPAIIVNTDVISTVPETWDDLLAEEFTGKIGIRDPRTAGEGAVAFLAWAYANGGDENNLGPGHRVCPEVAAAVRPQGGIAGAGEGGDPRCHQVRLQCARLGSGGRGKGHQHQVVIPESPSTALRR